MSLIQLHKIHKHYRQATHDLHVLDDINLSINEGEMVAIMGPSGSGKSTLMNIIGLLDKPSDGTYFLSGKPQSDLSDDENADIRNQKIGFVFQQFHLLPKLDAKENVALPLLYRKMNAANSDKKALQYLDKVQMKSHALHRPNQLSGGQQQRVAIARALVGEPSVILADEPTGALDSKTGQEILNLFKQLNQKENKTIIIVTHDANVAKQCTRTIILADGKVVGDTL